MTQHDISIFDRASGDFKPTEVAAEFSQHAVWVGSGHLGKASQDQNIAVLQGALVHRLREKEQTVMRGFISPAVCPQVFSLLTHLWVCGEQG